MNIQVFSDPRKPAYLNFDASSRPLKDPISPETVAKVRAYRHGRIKQKLAEHDCAALLVYDPLNIRYATDCSDMQVWTMHNPSRYALVCTNGPEPGFSGCCSEIRSRLLLRGPRCGPCVDRRLQFADRLRQAVAIAPLSVPSDPTRSSRRSCN